MIIQWKQVWKSLGFTVYCKKSNKTQTWKGIKVTATKTLISFTESQKRPLLPLCKWEGAQTTEENFIKWGTGLTLTERWWLQTTLWSSSSGSIFEFKDSYISKIACRRLEASHPPLSACLFTVPTKRHDIYVCVLTVQDPSPTISSFKLL